MKIRITIPQIRCRKITFPRTAKDEIYLGYFITLAKTNNKKGTAEVRKYVSKKISNIQKHVRNKCKWKPENLETTIETGDADAMFINMALYECDDSAIYKKLVKTSDVLINPEDFDWATIEIPLDLTNWFSWVKSIWKLVVGLFNYLKQDDLLGEFSIAFPLMKEALGSGWDGFREIKFKRYGGDYRVAMNIEVLED